jgi:hypothetical protein
LLPRSTATLTGCWWRFFVVDLHIVPLELIYQHMIFLSQAILFDEGPHHVTEVHFDK